MEFIGKNLPNIQTQYSSSLDSVRTGITETTKALGVQGLESAFENFLAENIGNPGALDAQSWIGKVAQFPDPVSFFADHGDVLNKLDSPYVSEELFKLVKDDKFQPAAELESLVAILNQSFVDNNIQSDAQKIVTKPSAEELDVDSFKMLSGDSEELKPEEIFQKMLEFVDKKQQEIEAKMEEMKKRQAFNAFKERVFEEFENKVGSDENQAAASKDSAGSAGSADQRGIIIVGGKPQDPAADQGIIVVGGKPQDPSANRGIIIVGGTPQDSAAQRGIIIVGGKTDGTHFQTIDNSLESLQKDPKPETLQIFRQQLAAVQDMTSTAQKAVLLQKEFTANSFSGRIQG